MASKGYDRFLSFLLCSLLILPISSFDDNVKSVNVALVSKWPSTPLLLEVSEFMSKQGGQTFWSFVNSINKLPDNSSDLDTYNFVMKKGQDLLQPLTLDVLKLSLSLRSYSPRVEMFLQISRHFKDKPKCAAFAQLNGKFICTTKELEAELKSSGLHSEPELYTFDHIYPTSAQASDLPVAILYGQLGENRCRELHSFLYKRAKDGQIKYVFRHFVVNEDQERLSLSGYGVELDIKSTEYKAEDDTKVDEANVDNLGSTQESSDDEVDGFLFHTLRKKYPQKLKELGQFKKHLLDDRNEVAPLKVWQLQNLGFQAAQRVLSAGNDALTTLRDISQNLPTFARPTIKFQVRNEVRKEIKANQKIFSAELGLDAGQSAMYFNGVPFALGEMTIYDLLEIIEEDSNVVSNLQKLGIAKEDQQHFIKLAAKSTFSSRVIDMRDNSVIYINNIETDQDYFRWPSSVQELLRPAFPGMLRYVRKNLYHVVFCIDPVESQSVEVIQMLDLFHRNYVPMRLGILFVSANKNKNVDGTVDASVGIVRAFSYIQESKGAQAALRWLTQLYGNSIPSAKQVVEKFKSWFGGTLVNKVLKNGGTYDNLRLESSSFFDSIGIRKLPQVIVNGVQLTDLHDIEGGIVGEYHNQMPKLQEYVQAGKISDSTNIYDYLMSQPHVIPRYSYQVFRDNLHYIKGLSRYTEESKADEVEGTSAAASIIKSVNYVISSKDSLKVRPLTFWVVVDLFTSSGKQLLLQALQYLSSSEKARVGVIHNTKSSSVLDGKRHSLIELYEALVQVDNFAEISSVKSLLSHFVEKQIDSISSLDEIRNVNVNDLKSALSEEAFQKSVYRKVQKGLEFCQSFINLEAGQNAIIANGKVYGPVSDDDPFVASDFRLVETLDWRHHLKKISKLLTKYQPGDTLDSIRMVSDMNMAISGLISDNSNYVRTQMPSLKHAHSAVTFSNSGSELGHEIVAIINPLSKDAQVMTPIIMNLLKATKVDITVLMNPASMLSEMPLNSFFRYVLEPELKFSKEGRLISKPVAQFTKIPESLLLTLNMKTPESWMVESMISVYDLDNIRLDQLNQGVKALYALEYILLEGHCFDSVTSEPPRGLQFVMGTDTDPAMVDTIVMANLGYFQMKANPGLWKLQLRPGRSENLYKIDSHDGEIGKSTDSIAISIENFKGKIIQVKVGKKPGKERESLLSDVPAGREQPGIWDSISNFVGSGTSQEGIETEFNETINIFTVASGHLYERFLRIMMLSVLKHTKNPVKFWFLKNFLSPNFKDSIPVMAKNYNFGYEYVQYKWPRWLRQQTEKQRVIWGYKILFLDVLFPLGIKKIIFVDADQIVRTDLKELMDLDLEGAPYAYTPFCDSRKEMDGFSALYVVDLKRFRLLAAGDRLRGQYQGLSADPNSLANLDQDLPNNMIHQVPIKSLPQDWLWCETWCSDGSKATAKTIDMCNNPLTKEPKLDRAIRIAEEWKDYDKEIKSVLEEYKNAESKSSSARDDHKSKRKDEL
ncbi:UDP-glucose:glycoprotein glucosyltransferase 1 [Trichoplax sp. H2]|nr:UDP-glucose:glycoprotein glucosyltransferase 1 [Trichoplax sp. H2]|eukprot:RDD46683.1 UDP-glucose:glycoprotein glucosyltransferase 1 [Trichoplax sp. H2]